MISSEAKGIILLGGDFNTVQNGRYDRLPPHQGPSTKKSRVLNNVTKELGLTDPWRENNPKCKDYTFYSNPHGSYSRIDFFYVSQQHIHKVLKCDIQNITISDHAPITLTMALDNEPMFRYWRLNVSLLSSDNVVQEIKQNLIEYFQINDNGEVSPSILWEGGKAVIRGKITEISSRLKRTRLKKQKELEDKIKELQRKHKRTSDKSTFGELKTARDELDELLTFKAEGSLRFLSQRYYEMGNRASQLLAFQLRKAQTNRIIPKIKHLTSKQVLRKPKAIAEAFADYCKNLYDDHEADWGKSETEAFLGKINLPTLSEEEASEMIEPISTQEILDTGDGWVSGGVL